MAFIELPALLRGFESRLWIHHLLQLCPTEMNVQFGPVNKGAILIYFECLNLGRFHVFKFRNLCDWNIQASKIWRDDVQDSVLKSRIKDEISVFI